MIAFTDEVGEIVHIASEFSEGVLDMIKYSKYKPNLIPEGYQVGDLFNEPQATPYKLGDVVFVYHYGKAFVITQLKNTDEVWAVILTEQHPSNPKMPLIVNPQYCNYPKVTNV